MDDFIYKYRFVIGGFLVAIILAGSGFLIWNKFYQGKANEENSQVTELQKQNDQLRTQLSQNSSQDIAGAATSNTQSASDKININTASATDLDKLPGIGPVRAGNIVAYREGKGGFKTIEEIKNIKGIGDATFEKMKDLITVGE